MGLLDKEEAVVRKKQSTQEVHMNASGRAITWCCCRFYSPFSCALALHCLEAKGVVEVTAFPLCPHSTLASLYSQQVAVLSPLALVSGWIFKLKHKPAMQLHSVSLGQVQDWHSCPSYCQALHLSELIVSQAGHCLQSIPTSIVFSR